MDDPAKQETNEKLFDQLKELIGKRSDETSKNLNKLHEDFVEIKVELAKIEQKLDNMDTSIINVSKWWVIGLFAVFEIIILLNLWLLPLKP